MEKRNKLIFFGKHFKACLDSWMEKNNKTQADFCKEAGVSKNIVTAWKRGERYPHEAQIEKICRVFGLPREDFNPILPIDIERTENGLTESRSLELQQYAKRKGLDEEFYQWIIQKRSFLQKFPFHKRDGWYWNNPLMSKLDPNDPLSGIGERQGFQRFDLVKYQFEDDFGHRVMMSEQDIDFLIKLQKQAKDQIGYKMYCERLKLDRDQVENWVDIRLKFIDINRDEVLQRLYAIDLTCTDQRITEKTVSDLIKQMAIEKGIEPRPVTKDQIAAMYPGDTRDYTKMMNRVNASWGASKEEIEQLNNESERRRREARQAAIEEYKKLGLLIEDDTTEAEDQENGKH